MTENKYDNEAALIAAAADIILENILTPILYYYVDEVYEFILFSDANTSIDCFRRTEEAINLNLGINAEIIDLREFDMSDRLDIVHDAYLAYCEDDTTEKMFQSAMLADMYSYELTKQLAIKRKRETGSYYIS